MMGKHDKGIAGLAAEHVFELFRQGAGNGLIFHGFKRSRDVVAAAKEIGKGMKLDEGEMPVLLLAAWFHDAAYAVSPDGDRKKGIEVARAFLARQGAPAELADAVASVIESAERPADGQRLGEILHDALLVPLANKDFVREAELYRLEQERRSAKRLSDVEWTQWCIAFVERHGYRTRYAQIEYDGGREANLIKLHKLLREQQDEAEERRADEEKAKKGAVKTVENVFYFFTKMVIQVMSVADRRTSTMIHVNAIMISAVVAFLLRRIETQRYLLVPTLVLLAVNLVVIFISVYSMRIGPMRREQASHATNVFVIDNAAPVSLEQYQESMNALAVDGPGLQQAMIQQLYFSREILNQRRRALRLTYDVFIYGLAFSLAVFAFVLVRQ
jgi:Family of unknown function (DUF5706)